MIDGREISDYSETEYRKLVGAVFQDMMVMATSVAENIACEKQENIDEPKLRTAMQLADIEDKVLSLPKKEKTAVTNFWIRMACCFRAENYSAYYWRELYIRTHRFCC